MWQQSGIADLLALTALSGVLLARSIWRRRQTAGANALFALVLAATLWAAASFVELSATRTSIKILAAKFEYVGVQNVPPLWVMFALSFAGRGHLVTLRRAIALWLVPAAVIALAVTNELHGTIWPAVQQVTTAAGTSPAVGACCRRQSSPYSEISRASVATRAASPPTTTICTAFILQLPLDR